MSIKAVSMPSDRFERCSLSPGDLNLNLAPYATPEDLEKCLSGFTSLQLGTVLKNGETMRDELLRYALAEAAYFGNKTLIEYVVRTRGPYSLNMGDIHGVPVLGLAMRSYHTTAPQKSSTTALLVQLGSKVNILVERRKGNYHRLTLLEEAVRLGSYNDQALSLAQLLLRSGGCIEDPTNLQLRELHRLILAQTKLAEKVDRAKKRADEVRKTLDKVLPIVLITLINELDEEPLV